MHVLCLSFLTLFATQMSVGFSSEAKPSVEEMLQEMAKVFPKKIGEKFVFTSEVLIQPADETGYILVDQKPLETWHVLVTEGRNVKVGRGTTENTKVLYYTTYPGLTMMYEGTLNPLTAAAASSSKDPVFLRWHRAEGLLPSLELRAQAQIFLFFFNRSWPHKSVLDLQHSRKVHGANAIGLHYWPGLRSAWYIVQKGVRLNEPGDTDPHHQAFIFVSGSGTAKIGDQTVPVRAGEAYYIPPGSEHMVWTDQDEPIMLIWLAWGEEA